MVMAERAFSILNDATRLETKGIVRLQVPNLSDSGAGYRCACEIEAGRGTEVRYCYGSDGCHTIHLAHVMLTVDIDALKPNLGGRIVWMEQEVQVSDLDPHVDIFLLREPGLRAFHRDA